MDAWKVFSNTTKFEILEAFNEGERPQEVNAPAAAPTKPSALTKEGSNASLKSGGKHASKCYKCHTSDLGGGGACMYSECDRLVCQGCAHPQPRKQKNGRRPKSDMEEGEVCEVFEDPNMMLCSR